MGDTKIEDDYEHLKEFLRNRNTGLECENKTIHHKKILPKDRHKKNELTKLLYKIKLNELKLILLKLDSVL